MKKAYDFFENLTLGSKEKAIVERILKEIKNRLSFMLNVGLSYLTLNRSSATLSGGEDQRIRLATQISSGLAGVLYVLDEPSIGLHPRRPAELALQCDWQEVWRQPAPHGRVPGNHPR